MEYYTQEAIEKANKIDPKKKKIKKIIKFVLIFFIVYVIISNTPLFGLAVVSLRWGRPMIYKEHLQTGAIWDLRERTHTAFTAYPLFGDPEEDEFCIKRDNRLIVFPWDIEDGYVLVYKRDKIEAEATRIAQEAGFEHIKVYLNRMSYITSASELNRLSSVEKIISREKNQINIEYYIYCDEDISKEELLNRFSYIQKQYGNIRILEMKVCKNKEDFDLIERKKDRTNISGIYFWTMYGDEIETNI